MVIGARKCKKMPVSTLKKYLKDPSLIVDIRERLMGGKKAKNIFQGPMEAIES